MSGFVRFVQASRYRDFGCFLFLSTFVPISEITHSDEGCPDKSILSVFLRFRAGEGFVVGIYNPDMVTFKTDKSLVSEVVSGTPVGPFLISLFSSPGNS